MSLIHDYEWMKKKIDDYTRLKDTDYRNNNI